MSMSNDVGYVKRYDDDNSIKNMPYMFNGSDQRPNGYSDSDLKRMYLTREDLNSRVNKATEPVTQQDVLKYR